MWRSRSSQDNHAGFQFWVQRHGIGIKGLDRSLRAQAVGHGVVVDLRVPPLDSSDFYILDTTRHGRPFDPKGGGTWSLRLRGTIGKTKVDLLFPVVFPGYPRVSTAMFGGSPSANGNDQTGAPGPMWIIVVTSGVVVVAGLTARWLWRSRISRQQTAKAVAVR